MRRCLVFLVLSLALPVSAHAEEKYYVILFASQLPSNAPRFSHTWATFVKVSQDDSRDGDEPEAEPITISWLPANGNIPPVLPVPGRNFGLDETIRWARSQGTQITAYGPVPIRKELFDLARRRKQMLDGGGVSYKMVIMGPRPSPVTNCIHAVSDVVGGPLLMTGTARGDSATLAIARHMRPYMLNAENHPEVLDLLRIPRSAVTLRTMD